MLENLGGATNILKVHQGGCENLLVYFIPNMHVNIMAWLHNRGGWEKIVCMFKWTMEWMHNRGEKNVFVCSREIEGWPQFFFIIATPPPNCNCWQLSKYCYKLQGAQSFWLSSYVHEQMLMSFETRVVCSRAQVLC